MVTRIKIFVDGYGDGEVPPVDSEELTLMKMILPDSESLYDTSLGFEPESNIKTPMNGFSAAYQDYFFPLIDSQSGILFEIVQVRANYFLISIS
jgi:hypothetical protein